MLQTAERIERATVDVGGLFQVLDRELVERQLRKLPGVRDVEVSYASGTATVSFDALHTSLEEVERRIRECGYHCGGEVLPAHVCAAEPAHKAAEHVHAAGHPPKGAPARDAMAHEMGHAAGMDAHAMARDMRNRFWVSLIFSIPVVLLSPMAGMEALIRVPAAANPDYILSLFASAAIIYPVWPFVVAAIRALRKGMANMAVLVLLSVGTGYLFSIGSTFIYGGPQFYEAVSMLLVFILLGHWLEMRARAGRRARSRSGNQRSLITWSRRVWTRRNCSDGRLQSRRAPSIRSRKRF